MRLLDWWGQTDPNRIKYSPLEPPYLEAIAEAVYGLHNWKDADDHSHYLWRGVAFRVADALRRAGYKIVRDE